MKRELQFARFVGGLAFALAACGGGTDVADGPIVDGGVGDRRIDGPSDGSAGDIQPTATSWPALLATGICDHLVRCSVIHDRAACVDHFSRESDEAQESLNVATFMQQGHISFFPTAAVECLAELTEASCSINAGETIEDFHSPCEGVFQGQIAVGGKCRIDKQCQSQRCGDFNTCNSDLSCCWGTCQARASLGQPCGESFSCVAGAECVNGLCAPPPTLGQSCSGGRCVRSVCGYHTSICVAASVEGEPCMEAHECDATLASYCDTDLRRCRRFPDNGQPCGPRGECQPPQSHCDQQGICRAKLPLAAACTNDSDCIAGRCLEAATGRPVGSSASPGVCRLSDPEPVTCAGAPPP